MGAAVGAKLSSTPTSNVPLPEKLPTRMQSTKSAAAKYHVAFSKKLVVRCTPPIWLGALETVGKSSSLGVLDQNHCPQQEAHNQNNDGQKSSHGLRFKCCAAF